MQQPQPPIATLNVVDIAKGMLRRPYLVVGCLILGCLAGLGVVSVNKPKYASEAQILVANLATPFDRPNAVQDPTTELIDDRFVASQVAVLKSGDLATRVVKQLELEGRGEFDPVRNGVGKIKEIMLKLGFGTDQRLMDKMQRAVLHLSDNSTIYQVPLSSVITIRYTASDGKTAAAVANALAETYVLSTRESATGPNARAREWLSGQIEILRKKVSASEAAAEKFRADAGLLKGQSTTLGTQEISELNTQITLAESASSEARAKADEIQAMLENQGSVDASAEVLNSTVVQRLREQQVSAMRKVSELSATYLPDHPKMVAANRELGSVEKQLRREVLKVVDSLQNQAKVAEKRAASLRASLEEMKSREGGALQSDVKLQELEREAAADRTLLETMLARYADASARQDMSLQPGYARIIQTADVPALPFFPKVGPTVLLAAMAGLALGMGLSFLFEIIRQSGQIARMASQQGAMQADRAAMHVASGQIILNVPGLDLGPQPRNPEPPRGGEAAPSQAAYPLPPAHVVNPVVESLPQMLASLPAAPQLMKAFVQLEDIGAVPELSEPLGRISAAMAEAAAGGSKAFALTSLGGSYDTSFASVALARLLNARKLKTMLIDVTANRPNAQDLMALSDGAGLSDLLSGRAAVGKVIARDPKSDVQVIRYGNAAGGTPSHLVAARMPAILVSLAEIYDVILLNAGEATASTPDAVQGVGSVIFLTTQQRQRDALAGARSLSARGLRQSYFVKLEASSEGGTLKATG